MKQSQRVEYLKQQACDIRTRIIEKAAQDGGHVSSPLGAVELIQGVLEVFDVPQDGVFFDTGHFVDAYKLLTGRDEVYDSIDTFGGMCRFPKPSESRWDFFGTGHSGTALSAALGFALMHPSSWAIAIIGDGAFTGGQPFEAMNHAASMVSNLVILYNDNGYSSTETPGYLAQTQTVQMYAESLGYYYLYIENGNDIAQILDGLTIVNRESMLWFVQVKTQKGYGYEYSKNDPIAFHSTAPFDVQSGEMPQPERYGWYQEFFFQQKRRHPDLMAVSPAAERDTGLYQIKAQFPDSIIDTGISEQHCVTLCTSLAMQGVPVWGVIPAPFLPRAFDQCIDASLHECSWVLSLPRGGISHLGPTHHGYYHQAFGHGLSGVEVIHAIDWHDYFSTVSHFFKISGIQWIVPPLGHGLSVGTIRPFDQVVSVRRGGRIAIVTIGHTHMAPSRIFLHQYDVSYIFVRSTTSGWIEELRDILDAWQVERVCIMEETLMGLTMGHEIIATLGLGREFLLWTLECTPPQGPIDDVLRCISRTESDLVSAWCERGWVYE